MVRLRAAESHICKSDKKFNRRILRIGDDAFMHHPGIKYQQIAGTYRVNLLVNPEFTAAGQYVACLLYTSRPARKVILKRGKKAAEYFSYCEEVGCDVWGLLTSIRSISGEPVCLWLPASLIRPGTSEYVQGVEVACDYDGAVPEGFEVIDLPPAKYLMFQGEPFEEEDYGEAICEVQEAIKKYDPSGIGLAWDTSNPRIQLEPRGTRGYIELLAVKPL